MLQHPAVRVNSDSFFAPKKNIAQSEYSSTMTGPGLDKRSIENFNTYWYFTVHKRNQTNHYILFTSILRTE